MFSCINRTKKKKRERRATLLSDSRTWSKLSGLRRAFHSNNAVGTVDITKWTSNSRREGRPVPHRNEMDPSPGDIPITLPATGSSGNHQWAHSSVQHSSPTRQTDNHFCRQKRITLLLKLTWVFVTMWHFLHHQTILTRLREQKACNICSKWQKNETQNHWQKDSTSKCHYEQNGNLKRDYKILSTKMKIHLTEIHET